MFYALDNALDNFSIYLGRWFGIPLTLHWSLTLFMFYLFLVDYNVALIYAALFWIIILHEFGHCFAARYFQWYVEKITIFPFGGMASINFTFKPKEEFVVTFCGPLVNIILIPILLPFYYSQYQTLHYIAVINIVILAFNLLPIFPMDGGRLVRSSLAYFTGNFYGSTLIAGRIGQAVCCAMCLYGIFNNEIILAIMAVFLFVKAQEEIEVAQSFKKEALFFDDLAREAESLMHDMTRRTARMKQLSDQRESER